MTLLVMLGCKGHLDPQTLNNQEIPGPFKITGEWQVIPFDPPLEVNRRGYQRLHLVVDDNLYIPNSDHNIDDMANHFNLRRKDGKLIKPELILIADGGIEIVTSPVSNTSLFKGGLTVGFGMYISHDVPSPLYPKEITHFVAARVRSNEPFTAEYLRWWMDVRFPEGAPEP